MDKWKQKLLSVAILAGLTVGVCSAETVYSVREGDTLDSVAQVHSTTPEKVRELNPHLAEKAFEPGLILLLPDNLSVKI